MADRSSNKLFKYPGGFYKGDVFHYGEDDMDDHYFTIVWGEVIHDPKVRIFKTGNKKTEFAIRYMRGGHVVVFIWGDTPAADAAEDLKATDMVTVMGILTTHRYENKYGEKKTLTTLSPFSVEPYDYTLFVQKLYRSPTIRKLLEQDEADAMESAGDYVGSADDDGEGARERYDDLFV